MDSAATRTSVRDLLEGLVSIPSLSGQEEAAVTWLRDRMADLGFDASIDPAGNAVGTRGEGPHEIMLLGHIDTVPGDIPVRVEDGILYGRGAVDAKGPLATFVAAAAQAALPDGVRLTVIGAVGEESLGSPGATWVRDHYQPPDAIIIGEPSDWQGVVLGYKGSIGFTASITQTLTHSAGPDMTAPELAIQFWNEITAWLAGHNNGDDRGFSTLDARVRDVNSGNDGLNEWATLSTTFRLPPEVHSTQVREQVEKLAAGKGIDLEWSFNAEAYRTDRRSPLVAPFLSSIRAAGGTPRIKVKTGTADMNVVGPAWGCPIVAYGPGDAGFDHTPDEQIPLADVDSAVEVLTLAIERYAGQLVKQGNTGEDS